MPTPADAQLVSTLIKDVRNPLRLIDTHFPWLQSEEEWRVFNGRLTKHVVCLVSDLGMQSAIALCAYSVVCSPDDSANVKRCRGFEA